MSIFERVKDLYKDNHRFGTVNGVDYDYTCPSPTNYPHQWIWDSSFHAITLTHIDIKRAKTEIKTLLSHQKEDGFIPCVSIWKKRYPLENLFYASTITQPPVPAIAVEIIYKKSKDLKFVKDVYPKLKKFTDWFYLNRDSNKNDLIEVVHPWETGIDSTPTFDKQLGIKKINPSFAELMGHYYWILFRCRLLNWNNEKILRKKVFLSENVLMNSIYAKSLKSMSLLASLIGNKKDSRVFLERYKKVLNSLIKYSWNEKDKIFYDLDQNSKQVKIKTISSLMPLILDDLPNKYVSSLIRHLKNPSEFWSSQPIPSVSMDEKTFNPNGGLVLWRGPTWINTNWFLVKTLLQKGYIKEANTITDKTASMIMKNGFWEYYNPYTGKGYGQPDFGWSALVLDLIMK